MEPIIIIGAGLAGWTTAREFRKLDTTTPVVLITGDSGDFYAKPSLSNAFAQKRAPAQLISTPAATMAQTLNVALLAHTRAEALDVEKQTVQTAQNGVQQTLVYSQLVLATGAQPIRVPVQGTAANRVLSVNSLDDFSVFHSALSPRAAGADSSEIDSKTVVIMGAGLIGCEFANDLAYAGFAVDVVHLGGWPLERLLPVEAGQRLANSLTALGVNWHFGRTAQHVERTENGYEVSLDNGETITADVVLSAIGLRPRTQLALAAGIPVGRGIQTNALLETGAAHVYAMGDCAEVEGLNLPYVQPLMVQARALAATLAGRYALEATPTPVVYPPMPVMVKTPAHPVAVLPPKIGAAGGWQVECNDTGICALHVDASGNLQGFALTGTETSRRTALAKTFAV